MVSTSVALRGKPKGRGKDLSSRKRGRKTRGRALGQAVYLLKWIIYLRWENVTELEKRETQIANNHSTSLIITEVEVPNMSNYFLSTKLAYT